MELTGELLGAAAVGIIVVLAAIGNYVRSLKAPPPEKANTILAGIGLGYVEREQMERLIHEVKRIADVIGDKNAAEVSDRLEHLAETIDKMQKPQSAPRRR